MVNVKTLERCFTEKIDNEMGNIVGMVADIIQNMILTAIDRTFNPKNELAFRSINASSGWDATSVMASSERRNYKGLTAPLESVSERNKTLHVLNMNGETRNKIPDEVSEFSFPETRFDSQPHTHHMVTGQTAQTNQIPEVLTGRSLTPREQQSY